MPYQHKGVLLRAAPRRSQKLTTLTRILVTRPFALPRAALVTIGTHTSPLAPCVQEHMRRKDCWRIVPMLEPLQGDEEHGRAEGSPGAALWKELHRRKRPSGFSPAELSILA
jgi:hypothetical protein